MLYNKNENIGQYKVMFPHKQGLYAETYRVKDLEGQKFFLKLINHNRLNRYQVKDDGQLVEVEISRLLNHHNLCKFIDTGMLTINGGQYTYIVTEFISGETLSEHIKHNSLEVYQIKEVAKAVLSALDFLHSQETSIIHNEVTIQNVLLNLVGGLKDLKLIDFGHACFLGQSLGKPNLNDLNAFYLAPERFSGVCSVQSDIYAVGAMMYHLLYGKLPWYIDVSRHPKGEEIDAILIEREKELYIPKLRKFELDNQLVNIIVKALSQDPESRFSSAKEFIQAIDGEIKVEKQSTRKKIVYSGDSTTNSPKPIIKKGEGFAAIAGMDELKQQLREEVIEPLHNPEEYRRYGVTIPNGMLLYGPPGCGKTFFAKHFAEEVGFNFMLITPASLKSRWVNASQENIAKMFKDAEENAPTIIFIDEINELVPNRENQHIHEMSVSAVNEMLAQMDRTGEKGVFVIGATNYPHMIDPAILRAGRLDKKYYVGVPDFSARKALFELYLKDRPYDLGLDYDELANMTADYVSADIQLIVNDAARNALHQHSRITMDLLRQAITKCRPSLSKKELERYEKIKAQMEGKGVEKAERPRIGFH